MVIGLNGSRGKLLVESYNKINIKLEDQVISKVNHAKSLGLTIDDRLSWSNHVNELCKKVTSATGALRRIRPLISQSTVVEVYISLHEVILCLHRVIETQFLTNQCA